MDEARAAGDAPPASAGASRLGSRLGSRRSSFDTGRPRALHSPVMGATGAELSLPAAPVRGSTQGWIADAPEEARRTPSPGRRVRSPSRSRSPSPPKLK